uniref:Uncharacterized protein n=1 Tax=Populus alba TaxID=43335 RepID=A0A4U5NKZ6_POPAL|nr:hypothetical protein D5086_0000267330 [Populus alba]
MRTLAPKTAPSHVSSAEGGGLINGFTPQQIGQLICLIHEHAQLHVHVFSLCILDSSRQHLASLVQGLIFEMLHKRDDVIACKSVPYPAVWEYRQRFLNSSSETWNEKEPLFYFPRFPLLGEANGEVMRGNIPPAANTVPSSPGQQPPKKTLAASIVESTKKQSIALVPKNISKLAQRLVPLFNPALFPHKPPPAAVANRVLFTDS